MSIITITYIFTYTFSIIVTRRFACREITFYFVINLMKGFKMELALNLFS